MMQTPDAPAPGPTARKKRASAMACDNCRRRKIRCNRERPCWRCVDVGLTCAYTSVPRRKGPKGASAHVLAFLRGGGIATASPSTNAPIVPSSAPDQVGSASPTPSLSLSHSSGASMGQSPLCRGFSPPRGPSKRRIPSTVLGAHVGLFLQHLYPIMPVIDSDLLADCADPDSLHPRRYAHIVALSAATHLQLNLDIGEDELSKENLVSGQGLIDEAVAALAEYDFLAHPHLETLLAMFFLFCAYGNLNKSDYAWHYLSQTISFLQILKMDREEMYVGFLPAEIELRRRMYWLVFITERAYALQTGRPVILRPSIRKPSVLNSEVPALLYGFVCLIAIFEQMSPDFYHWNTSPFHASQDGSIVRTMYQSLSNPPALLDEVSETHQVDIIVSQQWLLVCLWKCLSRRSSSPPRDQHDAPTLLPLYIPVSAGRTALACLSSASLPSVDAHGIGMEQKLYDIGESITQLAPQLKSSSPATPTIPPAVETRDLLKSILNALSRSRGSQSYLFSTLLNKSQDLLQSGHIPVSLSTPTEHLDLEHSQSEAVVEEQETTNSSSNVYAHPQMLPQHPDPEGAEWAFLQSSEMV